jgi:hypothetical protein
MTLCEYCRRPLRAYEGRRGPPRKYHADCAETAKHLRWEANRLAKRLLGLVRT